MKPKKFNFEVLDSEWSHMSPMILQRYVMSVFFFVSTDITVCSSKHASFLTSMVTLVTFARTGSSWYFGGEGAQNPNTFLNNGEKLKFLRKTIF